MSKTTGYILYSLLFDDVTFHAIFTSKDKLDDYIKEFIPWFHDAGWRYEELEIDPSECGTI